MASSSSDSGIPAETILIDAYETNSPVPAQLNGEQIVRMIDEGDRVKFGSAERNWKAWIKSVHLQSQRMNAAAEANFQNAIFGRCPLVLMSALGLLAPTKPTIYNLTPGSRDQYQEFKMDRCYGKGEAEFDGGSLEKGLFANRTDFPKPPAGQARCHALFVTADSRYSLNPEQLGKLQSLLPAGETLEAWTRLAPGPNTAEHPTAPLNIVGSGEGNNLPELAECFRRALSGIFVRNPAPDSLMVVLSTPNPVGFMFGAILRQVLVEDLKFRKIYFVEKVGNDYQLGFSAEEHLE